MTYLRMRKGNSICYEYNLKLLNDLCADIKQLARLPVKQFILLFWPYNAAEKIIGRWEISDFDSVELRTAHNQGHM